MGGQRVLRPGQGRRPAAATEDHVTTGIDVLGTSALPAHLQRLPRCESPLKRRAASSWMPFNLLYAIGWESWQPKTLLGLKRARPDDADTAQAMGVSINRPSNRASGRQQNADPQLTAEHQDGPQLVQLLRQASAARKDARKMARKGPQRNRVTDEDAAAPLANGGTPRPATCAAAGTCASGATTATTSSADWPQMEANQIRTKSQLHLPGVELERAGRWRRRNLAFIRFLNYLPSRYSTRIIGLTQRSEPLAFGELAASRRLLRQRIATLHRIQAGGALLPPCAPPDWLRRFLDQPRRPHELGLRGDRIPIMVARQVARATTPSFGRRAPAPY